MVEVGFKALHGFVDHAVGEQSQENPVLLDLPGKVVAALVDHRKDQFQVPHEETFALRQSLTPGEPDHGGMEFHMGRCGAGRIPFRGGLGIGVEGLFEVPEVCVRAIGRGPSRGSLQHKAGRENILDFGDGEVTDRQGPIGHACDQPFRNKLPQCFADRAARNAQALVDMGVAVHIPDSECTGPRLAVELNALLADPGRLHAMREAARENGHPDAAARVAELVDAHAR